MPRSVKRIYQALNVTFILVLSLMYVTMSHSTSENKLLNYGVAFFSLMTLTGILIFTEYEMKVKNNLSTILYVLVGVLLPILTLVWKYSYIIILAIFVPLLIYNLYKKRNANYSFKVENFYIINLIYIFTTFIALILMLTKQEYWFASIIMMLMPCFIDLVIYRDLKREQIPIAKKAYITTILTILMFLLAYFGQIIIIIGQPIKYNVNLIYPILSFVFLAILSKLNRRNILTLVNSNSTK